MIFFQNENDAYKRIKQDDFINELDSMKNETLFIIDCRSDREFNAGHIKGALHINQKHQLINLYKNYEKNHNATFIFHCEFSMYRAPALIQEFIKIHNKKQQYAKIKSDLYCAVLDGGYKSFYNNYRQFCDGGYEPEVPE